MEAMRLADASVTPGTYGAFKAHFDGAFLCDGYLRDAHSAGMQDRSVQGQTTEAQRVLLRDARSLVAGTWHSDGNVIFGDTTHHCHLCSIKGSSVWAKGVVPDPQNTWGEASAFLTLTHVAICR